MKPKIKIRPKGRKLFTLILLLIFIGIGCKKDELDYDDETIEISNSPGISIYKTKKDYIDSVQFQLLENGKTNGIPSYTRTSSRVKVDQDGNISQNFRWKLKSGYVVDKSSSIHDVFTDITVQEYVNYNEQNNVAAWPDSLLLPRIINYNPFIEYYHLNGLNTGERYFSLKELNSLFENGTIETIFKKLK